MKKLFTFAAAVLASVSLWAVDYYAPTADELIILTDGTNLVNHAAVTNAVNTFTISTDKYCADPEDVSKLTNKVPCLDLKDGNTKKTLTMAIAGCDSITLYHDKNAKARHIKAVLTPEGGAAATLEGPASTTYTGFQLDANTSYSIIFTGLEGTSGGDINVYAVRLHKGVTCEDPEAHLTFNKSTAYVGDQFSYNYSSKNGGALNDSYTLNGDPAVQGTDYTFSSGNLTVLKAGQFVMHRTVDEQDGYCAVDVSDTILISEKTPVTSFTVEGPTSARVGDEITLTAKDFNAAPTRVWWLDASTGEEIHEGATYTFTASKYGTFEYLVLARNDFNDPDEESYDYAFGLFGYIDVTIGHNAYLSDLKVNGETIDGFKDDKFEYDLGEIGVYEILNVVATPADAPYATAVVNVAATGVLVSVIAQDQTTIKEYIIHFTRKAASELASISASTTWDFSKTGTNEIKLTDSSLPKKTDEFVYADLLTNPDDSFNAEALAGIQEYVVRDGKYCQGGVLKFKTTVPGKVKLEFSNTGGKDSDTDPRPYRYVAVNKVVNTTVGSRTSTKVESSEISVPAGDILIEGSFEEYVEDTPQYLRVYKVIFTADGGTAIDNIEAGQVVKAIENGQLVIIKNGVRYNAQGAVVK